MSPAGTTVRLGVQVTPSGQEWRPGAFLLLPTLDGVALAELVTGYETARAFASVGDYGGVLVTPRFARHWAADLLAEGRLRRRHVATLLDHEDCGEPGCWPLRARVDVLEDGVVWHSFSQPHRKAWDYSGFGPFVFDADQYRSAVLRAVDGVRAVG